MAFQTLTIDLNANLQNLQGQLDQAAKLTDQASQRIQKSADGVGQALGDASNQADFAPLSKDAAAAAVSMDQLKASTTGAGAAADQAKTKLQALFDEIDKRAGESYDDLEGKAKTAGVVVGVGIAAALAATAYLIEKTVAGTVSLALDAAASLGDFATNVDAYKSKNIDALDEIDKHVRQLQTDLLTTAEAASALDLAFKQTGVPKDDYTSVYKATEDAIRKAIDAQDKLNQAVADSRQTNDTDKIAAAEKAVDQYSNAFKDLGIQYQDAKGKALDTTTVIANSAKALGDYAQGYDRNAAAAALAIGDYSKVVNASKINADNFGAAQQRLKDYFLVVGPVTQAALDEYHKAVDGFKTESDLMSQGFKAAIADSILPQLAGLADFFKDGLPSTVGLFREALTAAVAALEFFKTGVFTIAQPVIATFEAIGIGAAAGMLAVQKALHFDFSGALKELDDGRKAILERFSQLPEEVGARVALAEKNINLARGSDSTDADAKLGDRPVDFGAGNTFRGLRTPAADDKATKAGAANVDVAKKQLDEQLKALDVFVSKEKDLLSTLDDFLATNYNHGEISLGDYFNALDAERASHLVSTQEAYAKELAATEKYIAQTKANPDLSQDQSDARIAEAKTKIIDIQGKLAKAEFDSAVAAKKDADARKEALQAYGDQLLDLKAQIASFSGSTASAFAINFDKQHRTELAGYKAALASPATSQSDRDRANQAVIDLDQLRDQGITTAKLNDLSTARGVILGDLANEQAKIDLAVSTGQKSELQGLADSSAANKARLAYLEQIAATYDEIAKNSSNLQDQVNADAIHVELDKLKTQTDQVADAFNAIGESATENLVNKLGSGTVKARDLLKAFVTDIQSSLLKIEAKDVGTQLFGKDGLLSGVGKFASSFFPASAGAGSVSGAATQAGKDVLGGTGASASLTTLASSANAAAFALDRISGNSTASAVSGSTGFLGSVFGKLFGGSSPNTSTANASAAALSTDPNYFSSQGVTPYLHSGGIVGSESSYSRVIDLAAFRTARRFHTGGIAGDEEAIVAQKGEGIFTRAQMAKLAPASRSNGDTYVTNISNNYTDPKSRQSRSQIVNDYQRAIARQAATRSA